MANPWDDCIPLALQRLDWALTHIEKFDRAAEAFLNEKPYSMDRKPKREGGQLIGVEFVFRVAAKPPIVLRHIAGDAVHNLRAVVDSLVWGVANRVGADKRMSMVFKDHPTAFDRFRNKADTKWHLIPPAIQKWIEDEQVYNRAKMVGHSYRGRSTLHLLNDIWNGDKHRTPVLMGSAAPAVRLGGFPGDFMWFGCQNFVDGASIAGYRGVSANDIANFQPAFALDVAFEEHQEPAGRFLRKVEQHIRQEVIAKFQPFLP